MTNNISSQIPITPIHHIVDYRNLNSIIKLKGLFCKSQLIKWNIEHTDIAQSAINTRRSNTIVSKSKNDNLSDYVPFYFANRSPMLYSIHKGNVPSYGGTQRDIIYLVSSVQRIEQSGLNYCYTDGHPIIQISGFYDDLSIINDVIDWKIIHSWSWHDTNEDGDRKRKKQAEFLVHCSVPWNLIQKIAVKNYDMLQKIISIIEKSKCLHRPKIVIENNWYYND